MLTLSTTHSLLVQLFQRNQRTLLHLLMLLFVTKIQHALKISILISFLKVINSELIPGTWTYADLMAKNPQLVTDAMKLASINTQSQPAKRQRPTGKTISLLISLVLQWCKIKRLWQRLWIATKHSNETNEVQTVEDKLTETKDRLKRYKRECNRDIREQEQQNKQSMLKHWQKTKDIIDEITMLEANKASASSALTTLIQNAKDNYTYARQDRIDALDQYNKGFQLNSSNGRDGNETRCSKSTRSNKTASIVTSTPPILHKHWPNKCQRKERLWLPNSTRFEKLRSTERACEDGLITNTTLLILDSIKIWRNFVWLQAFTAGQNTVAQRNELIKSAMAQGATYQTYTVNQVMGTGGGLWDIRGMLKQFPNQA